ncbi:unnamed protein product [Rhizophagus irregularis]|nr:unnamed protein product [Rhizophagus irregularis]CAB5332997.1 unnamed protein product [Rhizophagus irregularis]
MNCKDLSATLLKNISRLLIEADDYNVFITVGEEPNVEIFQAHSVILRAMSPYFHAALSINWAQKAGHKFHFKKPNINPNIFKIILQYIYTGTIRLDDETSDLNLVELLTASDELVLMDLVDYIQEYIISLDRICWIDYKDDSSIYTSQQENPYNLILLLRGNRDGFGVEEFREKVFKQGPTIVVIHLAGSKDIIGGYNPLDWTGSNKFNQSTDSFIFSFRSEKKSSITTLSRVAKEKSAISDDDGHFIGFGHGDLKIFQSVCQKKDYMCPIHDLPSFQMSNYEVFKVVKKEIN